MDAVQGKTNSNVGLGTKSGAGMVASSGRITTANKDGSSRSFKVSGDAVKRFGEDKQRIRAEAISDTFGSASGLDYLSNLSKQIGASDAYSYLNDARYIQGSSETFGINAMTGFVRDYAINRYGSDSPENIRSSMSSLNNMAVHQGVQGQRNLRELQEDYIRRQGAGDVPQNSSREKNWLNRLINRFHLTGKLINRTLVIYMGHDANHGPYPLCPMYLLVYYPRLRPLAVICTPFL